MKFKKKCTGNAHKKIKTRKELRKEKRLEKKQKKNEYFTNRIKKNKEEIGNRQTKGNKTVDNRDKLKEMKNDRPNDSSILKPILKNVQGKSRELKQENTLANTLMERKRLKEKQIQNSIQANSKNVRKKQLKNANLVEDKEIKKLEKQLNLNKRKTKKIPSSFVSDGLDYLLELCDSEKRQEISKQEIQQLRDSDSEFENDLALVTGKSIKNRQQFVKKKKRDCFEEEEDNEFCDQNSDNDDDDDIVSDDDDIVNDQMNEDQFGDDIDSEDFSIDDDDMDIDYDSEEDIQDEKNQLAVDSDNSFRSKIKTKNKNLQENTNCKKVKFSDDLIKFEENETNVKKEINKKNMSNEERMKQLEGFVKGKTGVKEDKNEKQLSKEERMKQLKRFLKEKTDVKEDKNQKQLSKEERMKQLLGFVNSEKEELHEYSSDDTDNSKEDDTEFDDEFGISGTDDEDGEKKIVDGTWEDIYGRIRDKDGNVVETKTSTKYVPPHLRSVSTTNKETLILLKRKFKGLLNRLTENNIKTISNSVEQLFNEHSRHDVNETFLSIITECLLSEILTPEKMILEHVMLIAILHANIGTEIGASLLQNLIQDYAKLFSNSNCHCVNNKRLDNIIVMIVNFYQFKIVSHQILYDILNQLVDKFNEKTIELMLIILKTIGLSLRKDNIVEFKSTLLKIQSKANENEELKEKPRTKFMLDILLAVKNNNVHKIPGHDVSTIQRLKVNLKFLLRPSCYVSELNISLQDLLKATEKGRWWIVGSAWVGDSQDENDVKKLNQSSVSTGTTQFSQEILDLARKQRMNTDIRRNVFCILMTSEDYLDAYEKLLKLGVKQDQYEEIINVIVHCLLKEKLYNPYYFHLSTHFISSNRRFRMFVQYCVWDKFKILNDMSTQQITNLAKYLSALFINNSLPVCILKVIEFTELQKYHIKLIRQIFFSILLQDEEIVRNIFIKITKVPNLRLLREGLNLFLHTFVVNKLNSEDEHFTTMERNSSIIEEMLSPK